MEFQLQFWASEGMKVLPPLVPPLFLDVGEGTFLPVKAAGLVTAFRLSLHNISLSQTPQELANWPTHPRLQWPPVTSLFEFLSELGSPNLLLPSPPGL